MAKTVFRLKTGYVGASTVVNGVPLDFTKDTTYSTDVPEEIEALRAIEALTDDTGTKKEN